MFMIRVSSSNIAHPLACHWPHNLRRFLLRDFITALDLDAVEETLRVLNTRSLAPRVAAVESLRVHFYLVSRIVFDALWKSIVYLLISFSLKYLLATSVERVTIE